MQVNKNLSQELYQDAGEARTIKAKRYINQGKVNIIKTNYEDPNNFSITSIVSGNYDEYQVNIEVQKGELEIASCECPDYEKNYNVCKHIVATLMKFEQTKYWDNDVRIEERTANRNEQYKYRSFSNLISTFYNEELRILSEDEAVMLSNKDKVKFEPKIDYDKFTNTMNGK